MIPLVQNHPRLRTIESTTYIPSYTSSPRVPPGFAVLNPENQTFHTIYIFQGIIWKEID